MCNECTLYLHDLFNWSVGRTQCSYGHESCQITGKIHRHHETTQYQPSSHHLKETTPSSDPLLHHLKENHLPLNFYLNTQQIPSVCFSLVVRQPLCYSITILFSTYLHIWFVGAKIIILHRYKTQWEGDVSLVYQVCVFFFYLDKFLAVRLTHYLMHTCMLRREGRGRDWLQRLARTKRKAILGEPLRCLSCFTWPTPNTVTNTVVTTTLTVRQLITYKSRSLISIKKFSILY